MPATIASPSYTFTLRQLLPRDELVFKSVVRVLQGKTRHQWHYTPDEHANLMVLGDHPSATAPLSEDLADRCVIHVSVTAGYGFQGLSLPLRIGDVIAQLDEAGDEIARRGQPSGPAVQTIQVSPAESGTDLDAQRMSLTRWPEAALLQRDVRYLKLATVMTGQPVSIVELAARTQCPIQLCQGFVEALKAGHLVRVAGVPREVQALALAPVSGSIAYRQKPESSHHGLIARIRSRLEMFVGTAAAK